MPLLLEVLFRVTVSVLQYVFQAHTPQPVRLDLSGSQLELAVQVACLLPAGLLR